MNDIELSIRRLFPATPQTAPTSQLVVLAMIDVIGGFEAFNSPTAPYHNYETWGQGFRITAQGITVERESLEVALLAWEAAYRLKIGKKEKP